jgi:hypothetical protein
MANLLDMMKRTYELIHEIDGIENDYHNLKDLSGYATSLVPGAVAKINKRKSEIKKLEGKISTIAKKCTDAQWFATGVCPDENREDWAK